MGIPFDASKSRIPSASQNRPLDALLRLDYRSHLKITAKDDILQVAPIFNGFEGCGSFNGDRIHRVWAMKHPIKKPGSQNADAKQQGGRNKFEDRGGRIADRREL